MGGDPTPSKVTAYRRARDRSRAFRRQACALTLIVRLFSPALDTEIVAVPTTFHPF